MNTFAPFFLFGLGVEGYNSRGALELRKVTVAQQLREAGFAVDHVEGCYKGETEPALIAIPFQNREVQAGRDILRLARLYGQESILHCDANRNASLIYCDGRAPESLGPFRNVPEHEARARDAWTARAGQYYVCGYQHERRAG